MDPRDRLVDYALGRLAREDEAVDLSAQVRSAWERGVSGPEVEDLDLLEPIGLRALPSAPRARSRRTYALAAAAVVLVGVGLWRWSLPTALEQDEVPVAEVDLSRPLPVFEDGAWRLGEDGGVARPVGEPLWVDGLAPAVVQLPGGGSLAVQPGTRFVTTEGGARLDWGTLEASSGADPLELVLGGAHVRLAPDSVLACDLDADHRRPAPDELHLVEPARFALARGVARLRLQLHRGSAELLTEGEPTALATGATPSPSRP